MKKTPFYPLKRFFSILVLDKDIEDKGIEKSLEKPGIVHPLFLQTSKPQNAPISIQPEELGGIERINTRIFADDESIAPLFEEENTEYVEEEFLTPIISQQQEEILQKENSTTPEEDFYDYAMSDIPSSILSEEPVEIKESPRKNDKLVSLRDVLMERGNFWQDKKKVENIWDRDPNMPEEEMIISDTMVVGDVLPENISPPKLDTKNTEKEIS